MITQFFEREPPKRHVSRRGAGAFSPQNHASKSDADERPWALTDADGPSTTFAQRPLHLADSSPQASSPRGDARRQLPPNRESASRERATPEMTEVPSLVSQMQREMDVLRAEAATLRREIHYLRERDTKETPGVAESVRMGARLTAAEESARAAQREAADLRRVIDDKNHQLAAVTDQLDEVREELAQEKAERQADAMRFEELRASVRSSAEAAVAERIAALEADLAEATSVADEAIRQVKTLTRELQASQHELKRTKARLTETEAVLAETLESTDFCDAATARAELDAAEARASPSSKPPLRSVAFSVRAAPNGTESPAQNALKAAEARSSSRDAGAVAYDGSISWYRGGGGASTEREASRQAEQSKRGRALEAFLAATPAPHVRL